MPVRRSRRHSRVAVGSTLVVVIAVVVAAVATQASSARTSTSASNAAFTLSIGDIVPLTGPLSDQGPPFAKAADIAVRQAQVAFKKADWKNVKISLKNVDDGGSAANAVEVARQFIQSDDAGCLLGPSSSSAVIAVAQAAAVPGGVPLITPTASAPAITNLQDNGLVYRLQPSDVLQAAALAQVIKKKVGASATVALAGRNDPYGQGLLSPLKALLEKARVKTSGPVLYDPAASSFDSEAGSIVSGNPGSFAIMDFPGTYGQLAPALLRTGKFTGKDLFVAGPWPPTIPSNIPAAALEGATGTKPGSPHGTKAAEGFAQIYQRSPGTKVAYPSYANNFDAAIICILAAAAANSGNGSDIAKYVTRVSSPPGQKYNLLQLADAIRAVRAGKDINYEGAGGPVDFDKNGDLVSGFYDVYTYTSGAQKVNSHVTIRRKG